ncbi:MAG: hypothetical protein WCA20_37780 [Candidatus Sulfotelmatobacter sp.]
MIRNLRPSSAGGFHCVSPSLYVGHLLVNERDFKVLGGNRRLPTPTCSQVYLTRFPHPGARYQVSKDGGTQPVWSKDGKTLYFIDPYRKLTAVEIQSSGETVQIGAAKPLFTAGIRHSIPTEAYDVARDGRFLVVDSITESTAPVVLVTNWDAELRK